MLFCVYICLFELRNSLQDFVYKTRWLFTGLTNGRCKRFYDRKLPLYNLWWWCVLFCQGDPPFSKEVFWWQTHIKNLFFKSTSKASVIQAKGTKRIPKYWLLKNRECRKTRLFSKFFSHFLAFLFYFYYRYDNIYGKKKMSKEQQQHRTPQLGPPP